MAVLTARYSGSVESTIDADLEYFKKDQIEQHLKKLERENLHRVFWEEELVSKLDNHQRNPYVLVFRAARVANNEKVFLLHLFSYSISSMFLQKNLDYYLKTTKNNH